MCKEADLLELLKTDWLKTDNIQEKFEEIASVLFNNYCIMKGDTKYEFLEIEFYLYSPDHRDIITYPRDVEAGDWFFHQSGVDLCFGTVKTGDSIFKDKENEKDKDIVKEGVSFGGILIRSLKKGDKCITGPLNCCYELFDQFSAFKDESKCRQYPFIERINNETNVQENKNENILQIERFLHFSNEENKFIELITKFESNIEIDIKGKEQEEKELVNHNNDEKELFKYKNATYRYYVNFETIKNSNPKKSTEKYMKDVDLIKSSNKQVPKLQ